MAATPTSYNPSYRYGDADPVKIPFKAGVAVNVGDICYVDTSDGNTVKPAMSFPWTTNLATTQPLFVAQFCGIAAQQYDGVNAAAYGIADGALRVDSGGVYDFACAATTFGVGDLVGVAQDGANTNLAGQTVAKVTAVNEAIGRVVLAGTNLTTVRVQIYAPYLTLNNTGAV